jgi:hypothetical protein
VLSSWVSDRQLLLQHARCVGLFYIFQTSAVSRSSRSLRPKVTPRHLHSALPVQALLLLLLLLLLLKC